MIGRCKMNFNYVVFSVLKNYYLYDGVSSNILSISKELYDNHHIIFKNIENGTYESDKKFYKEYQEIFEAVNEGLLKESSDTNLKFWFESDNFTSDFSDEISHLMIGVTEKCNLRCKYCVFGGHYPNERVHSTENIDMQTLKNSLNVFFRISKSKNKIINFYGGEPLVNFDAVKYATEFVKSVDDSAMIFATTNGTLLNKSVCEWFIKNNNIHFYVSMAGLPQMHDKLRVTPNGGDTFNLIKSNLLYLKTMDKNAYANRIHFIFNIFSEYQLLELDEYWNTNELFEDMNTQPEISFIDCENDDGFVSDIGKKISEFYQKEYDFNLLDKYFELLNAKKYSHLLVRHFDEEFLSVHRRPNSDENLITGVCKPFVKKIFVNTRGDINLCENFMCNDFWGNVNSNIEINKVNAFLEKYKMARQKTCKQCWASKMCSLCFRDLFDNDSSINMNRAAHLCENERKYIKSMLEDYCYIMEKDNTILDHLNDYIITL